MSITICVAERCIGIDIFWRESVAFEMVLFVANSAH